MRMIFRRRQRKSSERVNSTAAIGTSDAEMADIWLFVFVSCRHPRKQPVVAMNSKSSFIQLYFNSWTYFPLMFSNAHWSKGTAGLQRCRCFTLLLSVQITALQHAFPLCGCRSALECLTLLKCLLFHRFWRCVPDNTVPAYQGQCDRR